MTADPRYPLGRKIVVMGRGGKTTLARAIAERFELPFLELDSITWKPNWEPRDRRERRVIQEQWIDDHPDGWVIDGDTVDTSGVEMTARADTVIWVNLAFPVVLWRILCRTARRLRTREQVCGENYETWRNSVFNRRSLILAHIWWRLNGRWTRHKRRLAGVMAGLSPRQQGFRLNKRRELNDFYARFGLTRPP